MYVAGVFAALYRPCVAVKAALMALGGAVHDGAKGQMPFVKAYIRAFHVQYVCPYTGEGIQVCNKAQQLVSVKEYIHGTPQTGQRMKKKRNAAFL